MKERIEKLFDYYAESYFFEEGDSEYLVNKEDFIEAVYKITEELLTKQRELCTENATVFYEYENPNPNSTHTHSNVISSVRIDKSSILNAKLEL